MGQFAQAGGQIFGALGGAGSAYRGYRPDRGNIQRYGYYQSKDINQLRGIATDRKGRPAKGGTPIGPYDDPTLGYGRGTLDLAKGLSEGDRIGERQRVFDQYSRSPYGTSGREYMSAQQGVSRGQREAGERTGAGLVVANEGQKRSDMAFRMGQTSSAYDQGVDMINNYAMNKHQSDLNRFQERKNRYAAVGTAAGAVVDAYMGGGMGGGMGG